MVRAWLSYLFTSRGIVLEQESEFARFETPSRKFIQFAEEFLSDVKLIHAIPKVCLLRIACCEYQDRLIQRIE
jgi:hypothetical protein